VYTLFRLLGFVTAGVCYAVVGIAAVTMLLILIVMAFTPPGWVLAPIIVTLIIMEIARVRRQRRRREAQVALGFVEQAVRLNLPLAEFIAAAADSERGALHQRLTQLHAQLANGEVMSRALDRAFPALSRRSRALLAVAEAMGQPGPALTRLVREDRHQRRTASQAQPPFIYPVLCALVISLIVMALLVFVSPRMEEIFNDFDVPMPWITQTLFGLSAINIGLALLGLLLVIMLVRIVRLLPPVGAAWDHLLWHLPWIGTAQRTRAMGDAAQVLADGMSLGMPMPGVLDHLSELRSSAALRKRVQRWSHHVAEGVPVDEAARQAGMEPLFVNMLASASRIEQPAQVFDFLVRYYRAAFSRVALLLQNSIGPAIVLILALIVGWIVLAVFYPLVAIIQHTVDLIGKP